MAKSDCISELQRLMRAIEPRQMSLTVCGVFLWKGGELHRTGLIQKTKIE